ncbi:hypothetical protein B5V03_22695 [Bradyrhizobium betae]|uniref:Uncharacterized protein n=1 Tax=Bradyrhizobium betae TaxID=244734 RepID=A0A4Q1V059_9BRAD|nr:hypothetical protein B5V03_22695 [Bradyrhizobium betae]
MIASVAPDARQHRTSDLAPSVERIEQQLAHERKTLFKQEFHFREECDYLDWRGCHIQPWSGIVIIDACDRKVRRMHPCLMILKGPDVQHRRGL